MFHVKIRAIHKKSSKPIHNIVLWIINMKFTKFPNHVIWPDGRRGGGRGKSISRTKIKESGILDSSDDDVIVNHGDDKDDDDDNDENSM